MTEYAGNAPNPQNGQSPPDNAPGKGLLSFGFLQDPLAERKDIAMVSNIIKRNRWPIPDDVKPELIKRLCAIAAKKSVNVMTKSGLVPADGPADINAVSAIRVLAMLESQNQRDQHKLLDIESERKSGGDTINVGCVGSIALGQEPLTPEDAKRQAQEVLARVRARIGQSLPPTPEATTVDVFPVQPIAGPSGHSCNLADL